MNGTFRGISYPPTYKYSSDSEHIPLEFYNETFPIAKKIDLFLGYFSSNAIKVLSKSFAEFIVNGGEMRIITNHVYSLKDKENLIDNTTLEDEDKIIDIFNDLEKLEFELNDYGQHFFDCLKYLQKEKRLIIQPVKFNNVDLAHCKKMILYDGKDHILTEGSINFTLPALIKNSESFQVETPWNGEVSIERIEDEKNNFEKIFSKIHPSYKYISKEKIEIVINSIGRDKDISDLLDNSLELKSNSYSEKVKRIIEKKRERFTKKIEELKIIDDKPHFPKFDGKIASPRPYQVEACKAWVENNCTGIFAMATGTGKTVTSLNCLLIEFDKTGFYQCIILVPTTILLKQWVEEVKKFNFNSIITSEMYGWDKSLGRILFLSSHGNYNNFVFITTYATFNGKTCQNLIRNKSLEKVVLIADEAHNLGSKKSRLNLAKNIKNRIGLSATPNRKYDFEGTSIVESYFDSYSPEYTYSYPMKKAIESGFLCKYEYYPYLTHLSHNEISDYRDISKKLLRHFDFKKGVYKESAERLLIERKRIIHQASNKKVIFKEILQGILERENGNISHTLVYVPEGYEHDYSNKSDYITEIDDKRIITQYSKIISELGISTHQILGETPERQKILKKFEEGKIDILTAMKTLDEGVDVPATRNAVFCASTGNPRQFIQRRGRILRNFPGKKMAFVYDIVVAPSPEFWEGESVKTKQLLKKMEENIFRGELYRVANFLYACENRHDLSIKSDKNLASLTRLAEKFGIDLDGLINELTAIDMK
ncbi:DEAD/DEAH box helicase family protein [uncultured Psychroserpens sp.]|uniref:DEAD/DEAH box helicase family protein n=1 Tax=uncultured Psychroserpens sp. TaxID=255436 RepID=UPI0026343F82|nr:DEAD/DEAH box helicase family protein [uncultured Psychroserpens sp.]